MPIPSRIGLLFLVACNQSAFSSAGSGPLTRSTLARQDKTTNNGSTQGNANLVTGKKGYKR